MGLKDLFTKLFGGQEEGAEENLTNLSEEVATEDVDQALSSSEEKEEEVVQEEQEEVLPETQASAEEVSASNEGELKIESVDGPENVESAEEVLSDKLPDIESNSEISEADINEKMEFAEITPEETDTEDKATGAEGAVENK